MSNIRQDILDKVDSMPAFPGSVHRVMELTSDINCSPAEIVKVIEHDPVLILKLLKLVNSAYFGLAQPITSVNHAIVYVGLNTVKNLAVSMAAVGALPRKNEAGFDMNAFLLHSLSTGTIAKLFAKKMKIPASALFDYFLSGLLHDFGKIVFANFMPEEFKKALNMAKENTIPLYDAENEIFGIDHAQVSSLLGEKWKLPPVIVEPLIGHHSHTGNLSLLTNIVSASDMISKELKIGNSGENIVGSLPDEVSALFGKDTEVIIKTLGDIQAEVEKAMLFIKA